MCRQLLENNGSIEIWTLNTGPRTNKLPLVAVFRIRIYVFFGLPNPDSDPLVRGMDPDPDPPLDPDPYIIMQKQ